MAGRQAHIQLVICRHTQTDDNAQHRYSGQNDVLLNEVGIAQAKKLAKKIAAAFPVRLIISSDLLRAQAVAQEISYANESQPPIELFEELRETHVGRMSGLAKTDVLIQFPENHHRSSNAHYDYRDIGGESSDNVASRLMRTIDSEAFRLQRSCLSEIPTVVLVCHGTALRTVFVDRLRLFRTLHKQGDYQVCHWLIGQL